MKPKPFLEIALILILILIPILILFFLPRTSLAGDEEARRSDTLTIYLENDVFAFDNNDRYYTHGTKISL
ncbi:MAG: lipid A deacylase LpxR family protein [Syntrophobacterales bacterium]|nr:lipid A deacylase LpxR family protein [Syntrophobacterales bacterium]